MICHIKSCSYSICGVCNNMNDFDCEYKDYRAIGTTEECRIAVEKQATVKPVETDDKDLSDIWYTCPKCHGDLTHVRSSYCGFCGQKLKWND